MAGRTGCAVGEASAEVGDLAEHFADKEARLPDAAEDRLSGLERRMERQERATEELRFRANSGFSQELIDKVVEYMEGAFGQLEGVEQVRYLILRDGTWHVVVVHGIEDDGLALDAICEKSIQVEDAFHVDVEPLVLHEEEALEEHLAGTKLVFSRSDQK